MILGEILKGAKAEINGQLTFQAQIQKSFEIALKLLQQILGTFLLMPDAIYAKRQYELIKKNHTWTRELNNHVQIEADIKYGDLPQNTLDIYIPRKPSISQNNSEQQLNQQLFPVVMFVHGGIWAGGDKWETAAMGIHLAEHGILTCMINYPFYTSNGNITTDDMTDYIQDAFDYIQMNIEYYGGDKQKIIFSGHSAGAQIAFVSLVKLVEGQRNVPCMFVGMAGVYDIFKHYAFEEMRGLHHCSTMARAMGGFQAFARNSPTCIFQDFLARRDNWDNENNNCDSNNGNGYRENKYDTFKNGKITVGLSNNNRLVASNKIDTKECKNNDDNNGVIKNGYPEQGDVQFSLPQKLDFNLGQKVDSRCFFYEKFQIEGEAATSRLYGVKRERYHPTDECPLELSVDSIGKFPEVVLMHGCEDQTAPCFESVELHNLLVESGVKSELFLYPKGSHVAYVMKWRSKRHVGIAKECVDLTEIIKKKMKNKKGMGMRGGYKMVGKLLF
eukprot:TRINITY_DN13047_c0_g1_i1.p1 TRINITY_DN13047_c0_g1~~TRINITY_DN13047_c0_g1_i1.p1  ORF type:complete len:501 (-),score=73.37 TRINITY_DN13047_c0_g1_i1:248-1750(-)